MKALHLNLAARPFRNYRPLYAAVAVSAIAIAFLMINNIQTYYRYVNETQSTRAEIARVEGQIVRERERSQVATQQVASIDTRELSLETNYVNAMLAERAFSWSELLDRLEETIPPDVRLATIMPSFTPGGNVQLSLECEAKSSDGMLTTLTRMQRSPWFASPFPSSESAADAGGFRFGLVVEYRPSIPRVTAKPRPAVRGR